MTVFAAASAQSQRLEGGGEGEVDPLVVARMVCFAGLIDAPLPHTWHNVLEAALPGAAPATVVGKIAADQLTMAPLGLSTFLVAMSLLSGGTLADGTDKVEIFAHQGFGRNARHDIRIVCEAHIQRIVVETPHDLLAQTLEKIERDIGIGIPAAANERGGEQCAGCRRDAEDDLPPGRAGKIHDLLARLFNLFEDRIGVAKQYSTRLCRLDAPGMAVKKFDTQFVFEFPNLET